MCPSSGPDDCEVLLPRVGIVPWLQEGYQNRLAGSCATNSCSHGTIPRRGNNTTQSSAPEDGHIVARNMLRNL